MLTEAQPALFLAVVSPLQAFNRFFLPREAASAVQTAVLSQSGEQQLLLRQERFYSWGVSWCWCSVGAVYQRVWGEDSLQTMWAGATFFFPKWQIGFPAAGFRLEQCIAHAFSAPPEGLRWAGLTLSLPCHIVSKFIKIKFEVFLMPKIQFLKASQKLLGNIPLCAGNCI